jgi:CRP-like cAMP-binding protein
MRQDPDSQQANPLRRMGAAHRYLREMTLFEQGSAAEFVYLLEDGQVKLVRAEENGSDVVVGLRSSGALLGDAAVLLAEPYCTTAQTITDCRAREIPAKEFRYYVRTDPALPLRLLQLQSREIHDQATRLASLGGLSARCRLERFLLETLVAQGRPINGSPQRIPPFKHSDVAATVVAAPEHLSRILKELERDGLIRRERGWLTALRPADLARSRNCASADKHQELR